MKEVAIISKVVGRDSSGKEVGYSLGAALPSVNLDDYLLRKVWASVFEIKTDNQGNAYLFGKLPVVTQYGITMYADGSDLDIPSIYNGLPIDGSTIYWEGGVLKANITEGVITNITSAMVVEALGYTPAKTSDIDSRIEELINGAPAAYDTLKEIADVLEGNINSIGDIITTLGTKWTQDDSKIANWDTAYKWGDHSKAGYALKTYVDGELTKYVTLGTAQTITGEKNFTGGLKVNGSPIVYDATNKYWKLEGDLLVTGGVTMYGSDSSFTPSTIMDGVVVDGVTIRKNPTSGALEFIGSVDGGTASSVAWDNVEGKPSFAAVATSGKYSDLSGVPTLLSSFTNDLGFITSYVDTKNTAGSTNTSSKIFLIGATSQAANPQTYSHDTAYVGTDGYLYSGNAKVLTAHQTIYNLTMQAGAFSAVTFDPNGAAKTVNIPTTTSHISEGDNLYYTDARAQAAITGGASTIVTSNLTANRALISNASGKVAVSAVTSTELGYLDGVTSAIQTQLNSKLAATSYTAADVLAKLLTVDGSGSGLDADLLDGLQPSALNVGSATKLQTARTIWGQSFNGTGNVTGAMSNVGNINSDVAVATEWTISKLSEPIFRVASAGLVVSPYDKTKGFISLRTGTNSVTTGEKELRLLPNGDIGIGTNSPVYKLDVIGDIRSTTNVRTPVATIDGIPIYKSQDDVLYIDGNLAVRGGITMYATDAIDVPSIIDALPIASTSEKGIAAFNPSDFAVTDGVVSFVGSAGSVDESVLADYAKKTDLNSYLPLSGGQMTGNIYYNFEMGGNIPAAGAIEYSSVDDFANKKSFIGNGFSTANNQWYDLISVRTDNGNGLYGFYIATHMTNQGNISWNKQLNGDWQGERIILDSENWSNYVSVTSAQSFYGTLQINGENALESFPALKFHIPNVNWAQFIMVSDGSIQLRSGASQDASYAGLTVGWLGVTRNFAIANYDSTAKLGISLYGNGDFVENYGILFTGTDNYGGQFGDVLTGDWATYFTMNGGSYVPGSNVRGWIFRHKVGGNMASIGADGNIQSTAWFRTIGDGGWYSETYGGGIYMSDSVWIRTYGGKSFYCDANVLAGGGITMYSDIRKKTKLQDVELTLEQIADAPLIEHYYNSDSMRTTHVGSVAQYWAGLNDWFCKLDNEGYYTMEIQNAALASAISIARELSRYESKTDRKIRLLKRRISELEDKIEKLELKTE